MGVRWSILHIHNCMIHVYMYIVHIGDIWQKERLMQPITMVLVVILLSAGVVTVFDKTAVEIFGKSC